MSGDSLVRTPMGSVTHAVTSDAPPSAVWPWLVQMGGGRAGWYGYDRIDDAGHPSSDSLHPEWQQLAVGDVVPAIPEAGNAFRVATIDPHRDLVLMVPDATGGHQVSSAFLLDPLSGQRTRLVVRGRVSSRGPAPTQPRPVHARLVTIERIYRGLARTPRPLMLLIAGAGHFVMEARMLRGIKRRAEFSWAASGSPVRRRDA